MDSFHSDHGWTPRWSFEGEPYAAVVFTTRPVQEGAWKKHGREVSLLVARFLASRLEHASEEDIGSDASFLYVLLGRPPGNGEEPLELEDGGVFVEFGFGEAPAAPDEWEAMPLCDLLDRSVQWLRGDVHSPSHDDRS